MLHVCRSSTAFYWLAIQIHIREVSGSYFRPGVGYPAVFLFSSDHTGKFWFSTLKKDMIASLRNFLNSAFLLT